MKKIISILALTLIISMSCKKEFLEILPKSTITLDLLFNTDKDFQDAVIGAYYEFQDFYDYYWQFGDLAGDDCIQSALRQTDRMRVDNFVNDVNDALLSNAWRDLYQVIERANTLLSNIESADASVITNKDLYIGEAKFIRALAYFDLVRIFGDLPMITAPVTVQAALETKRTAVDVIYNDVIIKDLIDAEAKLPETYSSANIGRATKGAAKSLLGLVYLTRKNFTLAESKLMEVTSMGYSLLPDFNDLFNFNNEHHKEYIFDIEYIDGNVGLGSVFQRDFLAEVQDVGLTFRDALRKKYGIQGAESGGAGTPNPEFMALFDPLDKRKDRTVITGIYDVDGNWVPIPESAALKALCLKYTAPIVTDGKVNWRVIRYADVLLMLAEALNENNKTTQALPYLNQVHKRAGLTEIAAGLTQSQLRDSIALERRLELYLEGTRWFDLVRTGEAMNACAKYGMKSHMTIFPVPQTQIEVVNDKDIFDQNEGY